MRFPRKITVYALRDETQHRHVKFYKYTQQCVKMRRFMIIHVNPCRLCNKLM